MDTTVRLWTIQPLPQWERLQRTGTMTADGRRAMRDFREAYRWMRGQMAARLPDYGGRHLLWAWRMPKPDLRRTAHLPSGTPGVRIEFRLPIGRALCSDFDAWHCVLNRQYLALTEGEDDAWHAQTPEARRASEIEKSWERIFDLKLLDGSTWAGPVRHIQAVFERLHLHEVIDVTRFIAK